MSPRKSEDNGRGTVRKSKKRGEKGEPRQKLEKLGEEALGVQRVMSCTFYRRLYMIGRDLIW